MLSYEAAREVVVKEASIRRGEPSIDTFDMLPELSSALGRVLAEDITADRDYPPFDRSTRDGYAVRSIDLDQVPRSLRLVGESKAGAGFEGGVNKGECVQIMTGAPVPSGADAVVMLEYTRASDHGQKADVVFERAAGRGQNIVGTGTEIRGGKVVVGKGSRLSHATLALAAQVGHTRLQVYRRPRIAILSTGDEVVPIDRKPGLFEIRNSNAVSLAAQAALAGAEPVPLGNAPDRKPELRALIERGLEEDILVLSGGVSMGKYDLVEAVLSDLGATFVFDAVAIRPGRPAVFAICRGKLVFGLPGNPVSTMVTFELFVAPAIDILTGTEPGPLPLFKAKLRKSTEQKAALTHFLPASVSFQDEGAVVEEIPWQGSGDIVALARANCFLVVSPTKLKLTAGDWVDVLPRRGLF
jgi:molybdopterin molybdotransferase